MKTMFSILALTLLLSCSPESNPIAPKPTPKDEYPPLYQIGSQSDDYIWGQVILRDNYGDEEPAYYNVQVVLTNSSGSPIDTLMTDSLGQWVFYDLAQGTYTVTASKTGYAAVMQETINSQEVVYDGSGDVLVDAMCLTDYIDDDMVSDLAITVTWSPVYGNFTDPTEVTDSVAKMIVTFKTMRKSIGQYYVCFTESQDADCSEAVLSRTNNGWHNGTGDGPYEVRIDISDQYPILRMMYKTRTVPTDFFLQLRPYVTTMDGGVFVPECYTPITLEIEQIRVGLAS